MQENKIISARVTCAREMRTLVLLLSLFLSYPAFISCAIFITWITAESNKSVAWLIVKEVRHGYIYIRSFVCKSIPTACFGRRQFPWSPIAKGKYSKRLHKMKFAWKRPVYLYLNHIYGVITLKVLRVATITWLTVTEYLCHKWHKYVPLVVITIRSFPHSWLITRIVTRVTQRVPHVEHELLTLPEHMSFSVVRVARFLVFNVMLCRSLFVLLSFFIWSLCCQSFFDLRLLIRLPLSYLQTFLITIRTLR